MRLKLRWRFYSPHVYFFSITVDWKRIGWKRNCSWKKTIELFASRKNLFFFFELATITLYIFLSFSFFLSSFFFPSSVFLHDSSIQLVIIVQTAFANVANSSFYEPCLHSESINMDPSRRRVWEDPDERFNLHSRDCVYDSPLSPRCRGNNVASLEICD